MPQPVMRLGGALVIAAFVLNPQDGAAQDTTSEAGLNVSREALRSFPVLRSLGDAPPVSTAGALTRLDGTATTIPVSAALALADVRAYVRELESVFPFSGLEYPADSLRQLRVMRANAWVARLRTVQSRGGAGATGWELIPFAQVAALADDDALAVQLFDTRAAEIANKPAELSYVFSEAAAAFADPTQDSRRLAGRLVLSERYIARLRALPLRGYRTKQDNFSVVARRASVEDTMIVAYDVMGAPAQVRAHAEQRIALVAYSTPEDRAGILLQAYRPAALALKLHLNAPAQFDTLRRRFREITQSIAATWLADSSPQRTRNITDFTRNARDAVATIDSSLAWLGTLAPAIAAHALLNTPDSLYQPAQRERSFGDGTIHVLLFMGLNDDGSEFVLQRLQQAFPNRVEALLVTSTSGANGPDLVTPPAEIEWLKHYYAGLRHFTMPIAVWGGPKQPMLQPEGKRGEVPQPSPVDTSAYRFRIGSFVVIDERGKVRVFQDAASRLQEALLWQRVRAMVSQSAQVTGRQ